MQNILPQEKDVYKRQSMAQVIINELDEIKKKFARPRRTVIDNCAEAVSYTHLDVYKRQRMKSAQKNQIMEDFAAGKTDVLVSTTVIEVGINVPNATVMMVENAERFGLAQLHQLRGRVGRGSAQSYCIFISSNENEEVMKRLKILNDSNDGFFIANEALKLRGPGDLAGVRQSGELAFKIGDIYRDSDLLLKACVLYTSRCV